jgi:hypothetical protein
MPGWLHSRNAGLTENTQIIAEGPARKRLQKTPSNAKRPEKRMTSAATAKPVLSNRRRASSIRDQNGPQGPRPPAFSPSKRSAMPLPAQEQLLTRLPLFQISQLKHRPSFQRKCQPNPDGHKQRLSFSCLLDQSHLTIQLRIYKSGQWRKS